MLISFLKFNILLDTPIVNFESGSGYTIMSGAAARIGFAITSGTNKYVKSDPERKAPNADNKGAP